MILFEDQMKCKSAFYKQFMFIDFYVTGMTYWFELSFPSVNPSLCLPMGHIFWIIKDQKYQKYYRTSLYHMESIKLIMFHNAHAVLILPQFYILFSIEVCR